MVVVPSMEEPSHPGAAHNQEPVTVANILAVLSAPTALDPVNILVPLTAEKRTPSAAAEAAWMDVD